MAIKEVNEEESVSLFSMGVFMGMWIFQINLRSAYGLHVPHFIISVSCSVGLWSGPGLDLVSPLKVLVCLCLSTFWSWS